MKKFAVVAVALGILAFATGVLRIRTAAVQRADAGGLLQPQRDAHVRFQRESADLSRRYQAGELDEPGWRHEAQAVQLRLKTDSEAAGTAWLSRLDSASRAEKHGFLLLLLGSLCGVAGFVIAVTGGQATKRRPAGTDHGHR